MTSLELCSRVKIIHGDMADVLPHIEVTAVVTDPVWPNAAVPLPGCEDPYGLFQRFVAALPPTVRRAAVILGADSDPGFLAPLHARLPFFRVCFLEYAQPSYKGRLLNGFDVAYLYGEPPKGTGIIPGRFLYTHGVPRRNDLHPCPRRLELVEWVVNKWTHDDDVVCDPFAGSGTTLLACRLHQRSAVGIEIHRPYYDNAVRYLNANQSIFGRELA
jgi:hypothetical protein